MRRVCTTWGTLMDRSVDKVGCRYYLLRYLMCLYSYFAQVMFRDLLGGTSQVGEGGSMQWVNHQVLVKYKFQQFSIG